VIVRKGCGVLVIEVKDWNLAAYRPNRGKHWTLEHNGARVKSPLVQVYDYKRNLFELHIDTLLETKIASPDVLNLVGCLVYFHNEVSDSLRQFFGHRSFGENKFCSAFDNLQVAGRDELTRDGVAAWVRGSGLDTPDARFDEAIYASIRRYLRPPFHPAKDGEPQIYPRQQARLIESRPGQQKIRGVAGSGKTMILARRAVAAHKRTGGPVLILTYNITLRNYIHDKISRVREDFAWDRFTIIHYHEFFKSMANNLSLPMNGLEDFDREDFFESAADRTPRFDAVFVDEVQDYKVEWLRSVRKYFLREGGEYVLFGDEKQNIYGRTLETDRRIRTNIPGTWNELTESFRLGDHIIALAKAYQRHFFGERYDLDEIEIAAERRDLFDEPRHYEYFHLNGAGDSADAVYDVYCTVGRKYDIHPNDLCIVSSRTSLLRELDFRIRTHHHERTLTMFESKEVYQQLCGTHLDAGEFDDAVKEVRKVKKFHFWMNPGTAKLATVHSFKGWEINTLMLVLYADETLANVGDVATSRERIADEELVYTAITRCRHKLFVINLGDRKYHSFFSRVALRAQ
jgi:hypothetical protein